MAVDMERARIILDDDMRDGLREAAKVAALLTSIQENDEALSSFLNGTLQALYNDARRNAGKDEIESSDMEPHIDAIILNVIMGTPVDYALFGAFMAVYCEGYDSE